jgi:uncharacterized protein
MLTFEKAIGAFSDDSGAGALPALEWLLDHWQDTAEPCRGLLNAYVRGADTSERSERALFYVLHALGEKADTAAFPDICSLVMHAERSDLILGDEGVIVTLPRILISTFDGDPAPLQRLVEAEAADDVVRGDALLVLAYFVRQRRLPEAWMQAYLAGLPARLRPATEHFVWFGWVRAVAALGYAGLAGAAEDLMRRGLVDSDLLTPKEFWQDLRDCQANPNDTDGPVWDHIGPMGSAVAELTAWGEDAEEPKPPAPLLNPLRDVGRNDPCPCGSRRKFKKCCLGKPDALISIAQ